MAVTPYMLLDLPIPTVTLGPEWASQLNADLELVDAHDHTTGKGNLIVSAAININADLNLNEFNLLSARSYRMQDQSSPLALVADLRSIYVSNDELYYNDGLGNQVKITSGGALNAAVIGGIGGDYSSSDANVYYESLSKTFFFDQITNRRAKLDIGDLTIRETIVSANGITIKSPTSLSAGYNITLPTAVPGSNLPISMNAAGELSIAQIVEAQIGTDAVTNTKIQDGAVTTDKIADSQITDVKIASASTLVTYVTETFTTSGTWTKPAGIVGNIIFVSGCGGGGGGGGGRSGGNSGGAGGAGAPIVTGIRCDVSALSSVSYTIGAGGAGSAGGSGFPGSDGSPSLWGTAIKFSGGKGGAFGAAGGGDTPGDTYNTSQYLLGFPGGNGSGPLGDNTSGTDSWMASGGSAPGVGDSGGGGGASWGNGGNGGQNGGSFSTAAAANTGAGGGGGAINLTGASGGSGIIEIYYWKKVNP